MRLFLVSAGLLLGALFFSGSASASSAQTGVSVGDSSAPVSMQAQPQPQMTAAPSQHSAVQPQPRSAGESVAIDALPHWSGNTYVMPAFSTRVMRDNTEWTEFWAMAKQRPPVSLPRDKMAVAVILGQRPSEGYSVRLVDVKKDGGNFIVTYIENRASRTDRSVDGISVPWVVQFLPLTDGRVRFIQVPGSN